MPSTAMISGESRGAMVLREAINEEGRYEPSRLAALLDWRLEEIARYLGKDASTVSRYGASLGYQKKLASLAEMFRELLGIINQDLPAARAWLRTPIRALD